MRELDNHLNSDPPADKALQGCPYKTIACPLHCAGCVKGVLRRNYSSHIGDNIDKLRGLVMGQAAVIKSVEQQSTQLAVQLANIEGEKQYFAQHVAELEAKINEQNERNERLESKCKELENEVKEVKGKLSSIERDSRYLQQQLTESEAKVGEEREMETSQLATSSDRQPDQSSSSRVPGTHITGTYEHTEAVFTMTNFEEYQKDGDV